VIYKDYLSTHFICLNTSSAGRFYVKATARVTDGKDFVESYGYAREDDMKKGMDLSQLTGSTSSYARKFALSGLLGLDDEEDSDVPTPKQLDKVADSQAKNTVTKEKIENEDERNELISLIQKRMGMATNGANPQEKASALKELCGVNKFDDIKNKTIPEMKAISEKILSHINEKIERNEALKKTPKTNTFKI